MFKTIRTLNKNQFVELISTNCITLVQNSWCVILYHSWWIIACRYLYSQTVLQFYACDWKYNLFQNFRIPMLPIYENVNLLTQDTLCRFNTYYLFLLSILIPICKTILKLSFYNHDVENVITSRWCSLDLLFVLFVVYNIVLCWS